MVVFDAYALIALLADEPAADDVAPLLATGEAAITSVNLAEAVDVLQRVYGASAFELEVILDRILGEPLALLPVGDVEAQRAGTLRARHYGRRSRPISLADCFLLAAAGPDDSVATADPPVVSVAHREGIDVLPLPDSAGWRP